MKLAALAPINWRELSKVIHAVPAQERWVGTAASQTAGAILSLCFPFWADELAGPQLPRPLLLELVVAQAHVLSLVQAHDAHLDHEEESGAEVLPLAALVHRKLAGIFPDPADPFWDAWARLNAEQAESARWEAAKPRERFGAPLVYRLGRKGALLRWPAFAVARLSRTAPRDRQLARVLSVLQMIDDLLDYESDAAKGQPNALVAAARHANGFELQLAAPSAAARVLEAIDRELDALRRPAPLVAHLRERARRTAEVVARKAHLRGAAHMLAMLTS